MSKRWLILVLLLAILSLVMGCGKTNQNSPKEINDNGKSNIETETTQNSDELVTKTFTITGFT